MFKFTTNKLLFSKYLSNSSSIASDRGTGNSLLNCVYIQSKDDKITIMTSNGELFIKSTIQASIDNEGEFLVNAKKLSDILKTFANDDNISIFYNDKNIEITGEKTNAIFTLQTVENTGYPEPSKEDILQQFTISSSKLKSMLDKTAYSTSKDMSRMVLTGIYFEKLIDSNILNLVSTDGKRLSIVSNEIEIDKDTEIKKLLPITAIIELQKIISDDDNITVFFTSNLVIFENSTTEVISNIISGDFLDYKSIIPDLPSKAIVETEILYNAIKRVSSILEKDNKIILSFSTDKLTISTDNPNIGEAIENISIQYTDKEFQIGFNNEFLLQSLSRIDTTNVILLVGTTFRPVILKETDNDNMMFVIGPMRIN